MIKAIAAAAFGLCLLGAQAALAEPMKCSGEQKTCVSNCIKGGNPIQAKACAENCRVSQANCMHSGCWAFGSLRYCGLLKQ
jgi:hypothetical protein